MIFCAVLSTGSNLGTGFADCDGDRSVEEESGRGK